MKRNTSAQLSFLDVIGRAVIAPRASLSDWLGQSIKLTDGTFWSAYGGSESTSGQVVTAGSALKLSTVWACVRLIATSISGLPFQVYKRLPNGSRELARGFHIFDIIHANPNEDMTAFQFWCAVVSSMLLWGNAYCEIHRMAGKVVAIDFLFPHRVKVDSVNGRLTYKYTPTEGGEPRPIPRENMLHIPGFSIDGQQGLSAIQFGVNVFGGAMAADGAANSTFKNGMMPTIAFKLNRILKPDQRDDFREYVTKVSGALNAGKSPVLEEGVTPEKIGIPPDEAQLLESRTFSVEEICRWFGVPPWMVGHTDKGSNWGTGLEQQMIAFLTFSISSITTQVQQSVNKKLLTASERVTYYSEFALEAFLKADSAARAQFYSTMSQNGIYTRDDCREKENLPRLGGNADVLTVQSNLTPLDKLGESNDSQKVRNALLSWLQTGEQAANPSSK